MNSYSRGGSSAPNMGEIKAENRTSEKTDRKFKGLGFNRNGKCLEEGMPAERYETSGEEWAVDVVYSEEYPPFIAAKKLGDEIKIEGNDETMNPYEKIGIETYEDRADDRTKEVSKVRFSTPNRFISPIDSAKHYVDIGIPKNIKELSETVVRKYSKEVDRSLKVCGLEN